jgi:hypothetical protein
MSKLPTPSLDRDRPRRGVRRRDPGTIVEVVDAVEPPHASAFPFLSFSYTRTEITSSGGTTQVKARRSSFADGRLTHESFEGELERSAYARAVGQAWQQVLAPTSALLQAMSMFLPGKRGPRDGDA